jgi:hypothetical protein
MAQVSIELIKDLIKKNPNDNDLGREVRKFFNKIKTNQKSLKSDK